MTREDRALMVAALTQLLTEHQAKLADPSYTTELANRIALLMERKEARYAGERGTRLRLLDLHSWKAMLAGVLMVVAGAPGVVEENLGLWVRPAMGYAALIAGVALLVGQRLYSDGRLEKYGLMLLGLWDLALAVMLLHAIVTFQGPWELCWPWELEPIDRLQPRLYAPVIYLALCSMLWGPHLRALLREHALFKADRKAA